MDVRIDEVMDWEDTEMDEWMDYLEVEDELEDMIIDLDEEEDWLDKLIRADLGTEDTHELEEKMRSVNIEDPLEMMEIVIEEDFLIWLVAELKELAIGEDILECIRTMGCPGNCACDIIEEVDECLNTVHCPAIVMITVR